MQDDNFIWDNIKNEINIKKHGISFQEARDVFYDVNSITDADFEHSYDEERFIIIGMTKATKLLCVCHCYREDGDVIRLISARKADKNETNLYWEEYNEEIY